jgi:hypothetical protein
MKSTDTLTLSKGDKVVFQSKEDFPEYSQRRFDVGGYRKLTDADTAQWYKDLKDDPCDSAGEPRLCPRHYFVDLPKGEYTVVRARCAPSISYYTRPGMTEVVGEDGVTYWVKRSLVLAVLPK